MPASGPSARSKARHVASSRTSCTRSTSGTPRARSAAAASRMRLRSSPSGRGSGHPDGNHSMFHVANVATPSAPGAPVETGAGAKIQTTAATAAAAKKA